MTSHMCSDSRLKGAMKLPTSRPRAMWVCVRGVDDKNETQTYRCLTILPCKSAGECNSVRGGEGGRLSARHVFQLLHAVFTHIKSACDLQLPHKLTNTPPAPSVNQASPCCSSGFSAASVMPWYITDAPLRSCCFLLYAPTAHSSVRPTTLPSSCGRYTTSPVCVCGRNTACHITARHSIVRE